MTSTMSLQKFVSKSQEMSEPQSKVRRRTKKSWRQISDITQYVLFFPLSFSLPVTLTTYFRYKLYIFTEWCEKWMKLLCA